MAMRERAARGVLWSTLEFGGGEGISFVVFLILARLVAPADFGIVALAGVFVSFVQIFLVQGFADAVIQREHLDADDCSTAFWVNFAIAAGFMLVILLSADAIARIFGHPELTDVLRWLSPLFVTTALISIHQALLKRHLRFASLALRAFVGVGVGGVVGIGLAFSGFGVWSLVGQQLANAVVSVIVLWWSSTWRPELRFSRRSLAEMGSFSANVIGSSFLAFVIKRSDIILLGYFFPAQQLGYYSLVQRILVTIGLLTLSTVQSIVMPVLSRLQNERERFCEVFAMVIQIVHSVWLPLVLGLGFVAPRLVPLLFGPQWLPSVPLLQILSLTGFSQVFSFFSGPALYAAGRPGAHMRLSLVQLVLTLALFLPATRFGLEGVAFSQVIASFLIIPIHFFVLKRYIGVEPGALLGRSWPSSFAALVMGAALIALDKGPFAGQGGAAALAALIAAGATIYFGVIALIAPRYLRHLLALVETALRGPAAAAP